MINAERRLEATTTARSKTTPHHSHHSLSLTDTAITHCELSNELYSIEMSQ